MSHVIVQVGLAVLRSMLIVLSGAYFSLKFKPEEKVLKCFSHLASSILTPSFVFSSVVDSLTLKLLAQAWLIPVAISFFILVAVLLTLAFGTWFLPAPYIPFTLLCSAFNNALALPILILHSLAARTPWIRKELDVAIALCFVYYNIQTTLIWLFGPPMIRFLEKRSHLSPTLTQTPIPCKGEPLRASPFSTPLHVKRTRSPLSGRVMFPLHEWNKKIQRFYTSQKRWMEVIYDMIHPSLVAVCSALIVIAIPELRRQFTDPQTGYFYVIFAALEVMGKATVPITLLILGADLATAIRTIRRPSLSPVPREEALPQDLVTHIGTKENIQERGISPRQPQLTALYSLPVSVALTITFIRLIVMPLGVANVFFFITSTLGVSWRLVHLIYFLEASCPTALQLNLLFKTRNYMSHDFSLLMLYLYAFCPFTMTLSLVLILTRLETG